MINSRDHQASDFSTKQEISSNSTDNGNTNSKASSSSTTTASSWSRFKDPRIVRVSKAFGGKDRHSKVCTVRGLRDRRVRLSVPTAIQLYDLQDRLGLNQPSKVVDWLLNVAKHEIDELPPLQIPQGMLNPMLDSHHHEFINASQSEKHGLKIRGDFNWNDHPLKHQRSSTEKSKDVSEETNGDDDHESWTRSHEEERQFSLDHHHYGGTNPASIPLMGPYNSSLVRWDPSNLTLSHHPPLISLGLSGDHQNHHEDMQNYSLVQLPSTLSVYQHGIMNTQPYFPSQISPTNASFHTPSDHHLSISTSSTQPLRPFHFSMAADLLPSLNSSVNEQNKHD